MPKTLVDVDLDGVARVINALDPVNYQDYVTKSFVRHHGVTAVAETSTTSTTTYINKATLVTPALPLGDYDITWSFKWRAGNANRGIQPQILQNTVEIVNHTHFIANVNERPYVSAKKELVGISGVQTFNFNYRVGIGSTTVYISEVHLDIERKA
jgi:hypothetical protein